MDVISTALTSAWLDAVRRAQSDMAQRLATIAPQSQPTHDERTLTDAIQRALESGGMRPATNNANPASGRRLDILV